MPVDTYIVIVVDTRDAGQVNEEGESRERTVVASVNTLWRAYDELYDCLALVATQGGVIIYWAIERGGEVLDEWRER